MPYPMCHVALDSRGCTYRTRSLLCWMNVCMLIGSSPYIFYPQLDCTCLCYDYVCKLGYEQQLLLPCFSKSPWSHYEWPYCLIWICPMHCSWVLINTSILKPDIGPCFGTFKYWVRASTHLSVMALNHGCTIFLTCHTFFLRDSRLLEWV